MQNHEGKFISLEQLQQELKSKGKGYQALAILESLSEGLAYQERVSSREAARALIVRMKRAAKKLGITVRTSYRRDEDGCTVFVWKEQYSEEVGDG